MVEPEAMVSNSFLDSSLIVKVNEEAASLMLEIDGMDMGRPSELQVPSSCLENDQIQPLNVQHSQAENSTITSFDAKPKKEKTLKKGYAVPTTTKNVKIMYMCKHCPFKTFEKKEIFSHNEIHDEEDEPLSSMKKEKKKAKKEKKKAKRAKKDASEKFRHPCIDCNCCKLQKQSDNEELRCPKCSYVTKSTRSLKLHMHAHNKNGGRKLFRCPDCEFSADSLGELNVHKQKTHAPKTKKRPVRPTLEAELAAPGYHPVQDEKMSWTVMGM